MISRWSQAGRWLLAVVPCGVTLLGLISPSTPIVFRFTIAAVFFLSLIDSAAGLLAVAALAPLGSYLAALAGLEHFRGSEALLLPFIAAWLVQKPPRHTNGPRLPRYATTAGWLFGVLVVSLTAGVVSQVLRYPDIFRTSLLALTESYFNYTDPTGVTECAKILEGMAIVAAAIELFRQRPALARWLPAALGTAAVGGALTSALLRFGIAPDEVLVRELRIGYRFAAHVADINAAGSHFVLVLCLALGMVAQERGRRRALWIAAAAACEFGLWMAASRTSQAAAAAVLPLAIWWITTSGWTPARRWKLFAGLVATVLVVLAFRVWQIETIPGNRAAGFRQQFIMSSFRIIGTHPWFGIGAGQYFLDAPLFLTPQLAWTYGSENSHNNFLQITTESGLAGFALFATWFAGGLISGVKALLVKPRDWRLLGAMAGVLAFLGTCVTGHPLLIQEVSLPFFLQFALVAGLGASTLLGRQIEEPGTARTSRVAVPPAFWLAVRVIGTVVLGVWPALTVVRPNAPVHLEEVDGFYYEPETDADGVPYRWSREYSSVFVPATARRVEIAMRAPAGTPANDPVPIEITSSGITFPAVFIGDAWKTITVELQPPPPPLTFNRINLRANHLSRNNGRLVGIRIGDVRVVRVAWEVMPASAGGPRRP
jgi:O-antigen ligase